MPSHTRTWAEAINDDRNKSAGKFLRGIVLTWIWTAVHYPLSLTRDGERRPLSPRLMKEGIAFAPNVAERDGWCREGESNPHSPFGPADFKFPSNEESII